VVIVKSIYGIVVALEGCDDVPLLVALHLYYADVRIRATNGNISSILVDGNTKCYGISAVYLHDLLDHSDVPSLKDAIRVD
jgi:hypothetical protein